MLSCCEDGDIALGAAKRVLPLQGTLMKEKPATQTLKRRTGLNVRKVGAESVILDKAGGLIHQLNPTATYIWEQCDGAATPESIVTRLIQVFQVDPADATRDVATLLAEMKRLNLLESGGTQNG